MFGWGKKRDDESEEQPTEETTEQTTDETSEQVEDVNQSFGGLNVGSSEETEERPSYGSEETEERPSYGSEETEERPSYGSEETEERPSYGSGDNEDGGYNKYSTNTDEYTSSDTGYAQDQSNY